MAGTQPRRSERGRELPPPPSAATAAAAHATGSSASRRSAKRRHRRHRRHRTRDGSSYRIPYESGSLSRSAGPAEDDASHIDHADHADHAASASASARRDQPPLSPSPSPPRRASSPPPPVDTSAGDAAFLRDYAARLSVELAREQGTVLDPAEAAVLVAEAEAAGAAGGRGGSLPDDTPVPAWWTDRALVAPLIVSYDTHVDALQETARVREEQLTAARTNIATLASENSSLRAELDRALEALHSRASDAAASGSGLAVAAAGLTPSDAEELAEMHDRIGLYQEENNILMSQVSVLQGEVDALRTELDSTRSSSSSSSTQLQRMAASLDEATAVAAEASARAAALQDELDRKSSELELREQEAASARAANSALEETVARAKLQTAEYKDAVDSLAAQQAALVSEASAAADAVQASAVLRSKITDLERSLEAANARATQREHALVQERDEVVTAMHSLERRLETSQRDLDEAYLRVKQALDALDEVRSERDRALLRAQHAEASLESCQTSLAAAMAGESADHAALLAAERARWEAELEKTSRELGAAQDANIKLSAESERLAREAKRFEAELEAIQSTAGRRRAREREEELTGALRTAQRAAADADATAESARNKHRRKEAEWARERATLETQLTEASKRIRHLESESLAAHDERVTALESRNAMAEQVKLAQDAAARTERRAATQLATLERSSQAAVGDLEHALRLAQRNLDDHALEAQELVAAQKALTAKWRAAASATADEFSAARKDLEAQLARAHTRIDQLSGRVADLLRERASMMEAAEAQAVVTSQLRAMLDAAERKAAADKLRIAKLAAAPAANENAPADAAAGPAPAAPASSLRASLEAQKQRHKSTSQSLRA
ncbi:uncharacterized protein AMSG_04637 [Thecamonas trahens ATCC 50062]|uniref:Uncharacterized protein n=1 Tax=Thecamonas trahens ATCC 50062 TaxID=461836 RepID=A0A0L0DC60_THETB|nr:hypothetical protein AMSG_04637 [Thecamonas trahens ATCC 50062]KNC48893.1 hypothetical protein AMSG_04637 [Thecamonas trahens ATCC 50062]|eukprot:XP_013758311.1 hypothetical protein AMSG_04637 [Thecamonas trahens ATCC 50062]